MRMTTGRRIACAAFAAVFLAACTPPPVSGPPAPPSGRSSDAPHSAPGGPSAADLESGIRGPESGFDLYGDPLPPGVLFRLGTVRFRHLAANALAYSPDGRFLASGGEDATIRLWETATGREARRFLGHAEEVRSIAFAPDGATLASGGEDDTVRLWDVATGEARAVLRGHTEDLWCVAFSPDGRTLASCGDDETIRIWDVASRRETRVLRGHEDWVSAVAFSSDGKTLASGGKDCSVRLWDPGTGRPRAVLHDHAAWVACVAFSPDGALLASGGEDNRIELYDAASGNRLRTVGQHRSRVNALAFTADGRGLISSGSDGKVLLWDAATGAVKASGEAGIAGGALARSPDGSTLAVAGDAERTFLLWDTGLWQRIDDRRGHAGIVNALALAPDGGLLASAGKEASVFLWDARRGRPRGPGLSTRGGATAFSSLAFSPDGRLLAIGWEGGVILLGAAAGGAREDILWPSPVLSVAFSPRSCRLTFASVGETLRVDAADGATPRAIGRGERGGFFGRKLSPDGRLLFLYAGQSDDRVRILAAATGREIARLPDRTACWMEPDFSPDGRLLACGGGEEGVTVVESATGGVVVRLPNDGEPIRRAVFAPGGRLLALQDGYRDVRLADLGSGRILQKVEPGGAGLGDALAFVPAVRAIAAAAGDTSILIWDAGPAWRALEAEPVPDLPDADTAWADLAGKDAARACRTVRALGRAGDRGVARLSDRLGRPVDPDGSAPRVRRLVAGLDDDDFEVRERAVRELKEVGDGVVPALQQALASARSAESRARLEAVLADVDTDAPVPLAPGDLLARHRAVWALERIGTPAARSILERLAAESPHVRERGEARDALDRMDARE